jgi:hypothetical protein
MARPEVPAFTIPEFCAAHRISRAFYYTLRSRGLAPDEAELLGRKIITHEAATRWRKQRTAASKRSGTLLKGTLLPDTEAAR